MLSNTDKNGFFSEWRQRHMKLPNVQIVWNNLVITFNQSLRSFSRTQDKIASYFSYLFTEIAELYNLSQLKIFIFEK